MKYDNCRSEFEKSSCHIISFHSELASYLISSQGEHEGGLPLLQGGSESAEAGRWWEDYMLGFGAYAASKAAVEAMVKVMAKELKGTGITANCVAPGPIATEMFFDGKTEEMVRKVVEECPLGRLGETHDVAPVVGFLVSDAGEWVNGQVVRVNGGYV
ncbi:hypothetical protein CsSME_00016686 [Camellia sinensis var. sinensis]